MNLLYSASGFDAEQPQLPSDQPALSSSQQPSLSQGGATALPFPFLQRAVGPPRPARVASIPADTTNCFLKRNDPVGTPWLLLFLWCCTLLLGQRPHVGNWREIPATGNGFARDGCPPTPPFICRPGVTVASEKHCSLMEARERQGDAG